MEPLVDNTDEESEHEKAVEEQLPQRVGDKKKSFWSFHKKNLQANMKLDSFSNTLKLVFGLRQAPPESLLDPYYCAIYSSSFEKVFTNHIFPAIECLDKNRHYYQALSGLCLVRRQKDTTQRYVVISYVNSENPAVRLVKIDRVFSCPDANLITGKSGKLYHLKDNLFELYRFEKGTRKLLGDTPAAVLERKAQFKSKRAQRKPAKPKQGDYTPASDSESESGTDSDEDVERKPRRSKDGLGSGQERGSKRGPSGSGSQPGKKARTSDGSGHGQRGQAPDGAGHAQPPTDGPAVQAAPGAGHEQPPAAAEGAVQSVVPAPQDAQEEEEDPAMYLLDLISYDAIARCVKNPGALAKACLQVVEEERQKKKVCEGQALAGEGMEEVTRTVKQWRKEAMEKMRLQNMVFRPPPKRLLTTSSDLGGRYPINDMFTLFMNRKFKANAVTAGTPPEGEPSTRKTCRHPKTSAPSGVWDGRVRPQEKDIQAAQTTHKYVHMDFARTPSRESDLLVVLFNKHMTMNLWDKNFPHLQKEGVDIRFAVMVHPDVWDRLGSDMQWRLFLEPTHKGFFNRSYFLFEGVDEGPVFDYQFMRDLCTDGLVDIYNKCNERARATLKHNGRSLHEIIEEALLPVVCERVRLENENILKRKQKHQRDQQKYEDRVRANPKDPTNKPPKPSLSDLLNGVGEDESPHPFPDSVCLVLIPLVFAVTCSRNLGLAHSGWCACHSARFPNPVTSTIFERYVEKPSARLCEMCGLTLPRDFSGLSSCLPLCDFYRGRV